VSGTAVGTGSNAGKMRPTSCWVICDRTSRREVVVTSASTNASTRAVCLWRTASPRVVPQANANGRSSGLPRGAGRKASMSAIEMGGVLALRWHRCAGERTAA